MKVITRNKLILLSTKITLPTKISMEIGKRKKTNVLQFNCQHVNFREYNPQITHESLEKIVPNALHIYVYVINIILRKFLGKFH